MMSCAARESGAAKIGSNHYLRTGRRPAPLELEFNPNHDPDSGRFTSGDGSGGGDGDGDGEDASANLAGEESGGGTGAAGGTAKLTPEARAFVDKVDGDFFLRTGKHLHVNSGTGGGPKAQAEAMLGKPLESWEIYKDKQALGEIKDAYNRSRANGESRAGQLSAMTDVIRRQVVQGRYISNHLISRAVDIRTISLSNAEKTGGRGRRELRGGALRGLRPAASIPKSRRPGGWGEPAPAGA